MKFSFPNSARLNAANHRSVSWLSCFLVSCFGFMLLPIAANAQQKVKRPHHYAITVTTGDENHAATDDYVWVTLHGHEGNTVPLRLPDLAGDDFQNEDKDDYVVTSNIDVGKIWGITLRITEDEEGNTDGTDGWYVHQIQVYHLGTDLDRKNVLSVVKNDILRQAYFPSNWSVTIDSWLDDEDNYRPQRIFGTEPAENEKVQSRIVGTWERIPTGELTGLEIGTAGSVYKNEFQNTTRAVLDQTETNSNSSRQEVSSTVGGSATVGEEGVSSVETHFEITASAAEEVAKEMSHHTSIENESLVKMSEDIPVPTLASDEVVIVRFWSVNYERKQEIRLGNRQLPYIAQANFIHPSISKPYKRGSEELIKELTELKEKFPKYFPAEGDRILSGK